MNTLIRSIGVILFFAVLLVGGTVQQTCARSPIHHKSTNYDILLMDGLLGTAVGGVAGLTVGVLGDAESEDVFTDYILPGMGIGVISGVVYALLSGNSPLYSRRLFMHNGQPKGILHFDADATLLDIEPIRALPRQKYSKEEESAQWRFELFTMSF
ncbi:MAG: hypothetical protein D3923_04585 [Candidatus Electrothrix sp. AR3]|nr:hypothetical protein [Candidatus Electrothrix sp. AR3]